VSRVHCGIWARLDAPLTGSIASSAFTQGALPALGDCLNFWFRAGTGVIDKYMTISEIASQLRVALVVCVGADGTVSSAERSYFAAVQNDASDESFWLSVSYLEDHQVPMFVAKQWAKQASNISEWMAFLERNTAPPENN
jgi:hypothetical protein